MASGCLQRPTTTHRSPESDPQAFGLAELARTQPSPPDIIPEFFATSPIATCLPHKPIIPQYALYAPPKSYWISTHLRSRFPHQDHFGGPSEHCPHRGAADASGQCRASLGPQITMDGLEFT